MSLIDWLIVLIPTTAVVSVGIYSRRYIKGVTDFLCAGRVVGRYVICMGTVATALSIIGLVAFVEVHYKTGFALVFWNNILLPLGVVISLFGYCTYRFRETKAMSMGQFLEMRYNRPLRIFGAALRSLTEMLTNMIMPAIAARFFIYFLGLPHKLNLFGWEISTFVVIVLICLLAVERPVFLEFRIPAGGIKADHVLSQGIKMGSCQSLPLNGTAKQNFTGYYQLILL